MEPVKNLSKNLLSIRRTRGLSQEEFSRELHIARSTLQQIEQGHTPTLATLAHIASRLDCPLSLLLDDAGTSIQQFRSLVEQLDWFASLSLENQSQFLLLSGQILDLLRKPPDQA